MIERGAHEQQEQHERGERAELRIARATPDRAEERLEADE
jgi:hypothetical protein